MECVFIYGLLVFTLFSVSSAEFFPVKEHQLEKETSYWMSRERNEIQKALKKPILNNRAKNVILFLGDGLGVTANTAGRIYKGQKEGFSGEESSLTWEEFPNIALVKTYNLDRQVADSAAAATAYLSGVKANFETIGVNGKVQINDCASSLNQENQVSSFIQWAQEAGKDTGIVTTTRITHATPAVTYAHCSNRSWECDAKIPEAFKQTCKDIARQLIEDEPGRNINVILGGGRRQFGVSLPGDDGRSCLRADNRNLVADWQKDKTERGLSHTFVTNKDEFDAIDVTNEDYIMGLFSGSNLPYTLDSNDTTPTIAEMTETAIKRLRRNNKGFALLVEGGRIDHALHDTKAKYFLEEILAFDEAVQRALNLVNLDETLIIVTADHSHVLTINGYPGRGSNILGQFIAKYVNDKLPITTLMFTNGPGFNFTWNGTHVSRVNLTGVDTTDKDFISPALAPTDAGSETHGGEDVAVYAAGPFAHLFHKMHEQSYVAHVMGYAACIGPYQDECSEASTGVRDETSARRMDLNEDDNINGATQQITLSLRLLMISFCLITYIIL